MSEWECRYCRLRQVASKDNAHTSFHAIFVGDLRSGAVGLRHIALRCLSPNCGQLNLSVQLAERTNSVGAHYEQGDTLHEWELLPESSAKNQPDFIPAVIRQDYYEACRIVDLSPKASATLSRRCLQGMIRDFCQITDRSLDQEITTLKNNVKKGVGPEGVNIDSIDAIDAIRKIGNIGAHMEKDINLIVDIEPNEAKILIAVIETLFDEWYVARDRRTKRFSSLKELASSKQAIRDGTSH